MPVLNSRRGNKLARQVNSAWFRYAQAWFPRSYGQSPHPLTVVIPLAEKDIGRLAKIDHPQIVEELLAIGRQAAAKQVMASHFPPVFD